MEFVDFKSSSKTCNIPEEYPLPTYSGSAGALTYGDKEIPIVCAGSYRVKGVRKSRDTCHFLQFQNKQWVWTKLDKTLAEKRFKPASIITDNGRTLWVTGGYNDQMKTSFKSTDLVSIVDEGEQLTAASFNIKPGPNLPVSSAKHCLVKLNSSTAMMIGGEKDDAPVKFSSTFFLDIQTGSSVPGPELSVARCWHKCGVLIQDHRSEDGNQQQQQQVVIAAGGLTGSTTIRSTEMWIVGSNQGWTEGPEVPVDIFHADAVTVPDVNKLLVAGGGDSLNLVYQFEYNRNEIWIWTKLDQELSMPRKRSMAMLLSNDFC